MITIPVAAFLLFLFILFYFIFSFAIAAKVWKHRALEAEHDIKQLIQ